MSHTPEERAAFMEQKKRQASHNVYQVLMDVFGANGTIPGVETEPLNIPEGLDEKTVAAIVAGSSLNPYRMSYPMGDFAAGSDITVNDQDLVMNQVTGGHVTPQTAGILAAGRRDAQTALEAYREGDDSLVKRHLKTYADHAVKKLGELTPDCNDPAASGQIALISDILNEDRFGITPSGLLISTEKLKAFRKAGDAGVQAGAQQQRRISEFDSLSQAEKEELAAEMLFNSYISAVPGAGQKQISEQVDQYIRKGLLPMGVSPEDPELYEQVKNDPAIIEETVKMRRNCHHMSITDEEAILAQDTGMDQLRELSMEEIKKSDLFKSIVNAKNKEELTDTLIDAQAQSANGFVSLEGVVIPAVSEEMNAQFQQMRETKITASLDKIPRAAANSAALNEMKAPYIINGLSPAHLGQAGSLAQQIYDLLTAAAPLEEDPAYMEIMATAHSTLKVANDHQGPGLFISGFERTTSLISNYISSGVQIEPEKLKALQQANLMAAAAADSLKASVLQRKEELTQKYGSEFYNTYVRNKNANFGKFPGEAYADPDKRPKVGSLSLERTGGHSMACLYLCSQGYSLEDIVDPDKLIEEKQAAFAHVVDLFKKPEDQAIKDIAKLMYDGRKAEFAQLDQLVKKIDFSDPELMNKKEMQILAQMMFIDFDIGQEVVRCKPEMVEAAKNDPDVHITSFKDYLNAYPILPLSNWISAMGGASEKVAELMTETSPDSLKKALGEIAGCRAQQNYILDAYKNAQKKNPDVPFTKMLPPDFALESGKVQASGEALKKAENSPLDLLANDPELVRKNVKALIEGPILDVRPDVDPLTGGLIKDKGFPKVSELPFSSRIELDVMTAPIDAKLSLAAANARDVRRRVNFGKSDFTDAVTAVEELNALRSSGAPEEQQKKAEEAQQKIDIYLNRKAKEASEGAHFSEKTQKCIDSMKACRKAVDDIRRSLSAQEKELDRQQEEIAGQDRKADDLEDFISAAQKAKEQLEQPMLSMARDKEKRKGKGSDSYITFTEALEDLQKMDPAKVSPGKYIGQLFLVQGAARTYERSHTGVRHPFSGWAGDAQARIDLARRVNEIVSLKLKELAPKYNKLLGENRFMCDDTIRKVQDKLSENTERTGKYPTKEGAKLEYAMIVAANLVKAEQKAGRMLAIDEKGLHDLAVDISVHSEPFNAVVKKYSDKEMYEKATHEKGQNLYSAYRAAQAQFQMYENIKKGSSRTEDKTNNKEIEKSKRN